MTTTTPSIAPTPTTPAAAPLKTVLILGVSYGGGHAAKLLASQLPEGWRVVAIDRNSHMNRESKEFELGMVHRRPRCLSA